MSNESNPVLNKYERTIKVDGLEFTFDVYDVIHAFGVTNAGDQHAIKKILAAGQRGYKDGNQDRREAIQSLQRAIELEVQHEA